MKNIVPWAVGVLLIVGGGWFLLSNMEKRAKDAEVAAMVADARLEAIRQVAAMVAGPDDHVGYDRQQVVRKNIEYMDAIRKKYPDYLKPDAFIADMEQKAAEGAKDKAKTAEYRVRYDYAKQLYNDYVKNGAYNTVLTGQSNGLRFDVVTVKKAIEGGQEGLRWDVFLWGAPPKDQLQLSNIEITNIIHFPELETSGKRKGQPKRTAMKINIAPAMPYVLLDKPWDWIPEWPAGVMAGYYIGIPMFDSRTDRANITITGQIRTAGGALVPITIKWSQVKIPPDWKGAPGGKWDDQTIQPLNDDDIKEGGIELTEVDPPADPNAAAPDKKHK